MTENHSVSLAESIAQKYAKQHVRMQDIVDFNSGLVADCLASYMTLELLQLCFYKPKTSKIEIKFASNWDTPTEGLIYYDANDNPHAYGYQYFTSFERDLFNKATIGVYRLISQFFQKKCIIFEELNHFGSHIVLDKSTQTLFSKVPSNYSERTRLLICGFIQLFKEKIEYTITNLYPNLNHNQKIEISVTYSEVIDELNCYYGYEGVEAIKNDSRCWKTAIHYLTKNGIVASSKGNTETYTFTHYVRKKYEERSLSKFLDDYLCTLVEIKYKEQQDTVKKTVVKTAKYKKAIIQLIKKVVQDYHPDSIIISYRENKVCAYTTESFKVRSHVKMITLDKNSFDEKCLKKAIQSFEELGFEKKKEPRYNKFVWVWNRNNEKAPNFKDVYSIYEEDSYPAKLSPEEEANMIRLYTNMIRNDFEKMYSKQPLLKSASITYLCECKKMYNSTEYHRFGHIFHFSAFEKAVEMLKSEGVEVDQSYIGYKLTITF